MPELVRLYIRQVLIGICLAIVFTGLLLWLDVAHLRHLVLADRAGWVAVVMLVVFNSIVFGGVQFAMTIMGMAERDDRPRGPKAPVTGGVAATDPAKVRVATGK